MSNIYRLLGEPNAVSVEITVKFKNGDVVTETVEKPGLLSVSLEKAFVESVYDGMVKRYHETSHRTLRIDYLTGKLPPIEGSDK